MKFWISNSEVRFDRGTGVTGGPEKSSYGFEPIMKVVVPIRFY